MSTSEGHRERLRQKFRQNPADVSETERLELLLTYAIPRRDVFPIAQELISKFGSLVNVLDAPDHELIQIDGIGEAVITLLHLTCHLAKETENPVTQNAKAPDAQLNLFELGAERMPRTIHRSEANTKKRPMRVFTNDEVANTLALLPNAPRFEKVADFKQYLNEKLPYNSADTRRRRAQYIVERFFPANDLNIPLTYYLSQSTSQSDLKPVIFYHLLQAEPIVAKVADELVWPALPVGRIERDQMREFVARYLPDASASSQAIMLRGLFYTYDYLGIGAVNDTTLRFQLHAGTLESFLYILTSVFSEPGMYSYEALYSSPVHRWLLWDREWIRQQLYNLQDFGVLTKVSEIDTVRQFTLAMDQASALQLFFTHPERGQRAIREQDRHQKTDQEG